MFLFPFDKIKRGDKIWIYGGGKVGRQYAEQLKTLRYCEVRGFIDRNPKVSSVNGYSVSSLNEVTFKRGEKIVIAIASVAESENVKSLLKEHRISERNIVHKIVKVNLEDMELESGRGNELSASNLPIRIAIVNQDGMGDVILDLPLICKLKRDLKDNVFIGYFSKYGELFNFAGLVDLKSNENVCKGYDLVLERSHSTFVLEWNEKRITEKSSQLAQFCKKMLEFQKDFSTKNNYRRIYDYAAFMGIHRTEISDPTGILGIGRNDELLFGWDGSVFNVLDKYGLVGKKYITINRDIEAKREGEHPKLWPKEYYTHLCKLIKMQFPDVLLVQIGAMDRDGCIEGIDLDLLGKTSINELKIVLKYSLLNISSEGGTVHLKHALYGKSVVVFGPTDENYFGYEQDFRFASRTCVGPCNYISNGWMKKCVKGFDKSECMSNVSADMVFSGITEYITDKVEEKVRVGVCNSIHKELLDRKDINSLYIGKYEGDNLDLVPNVNMFENDIPTFWGNLPVYDEKYDLIIVCSELEDKIRKDLYAFVRELFRILKKGGKLIISGQIYDQCCLTCNSNNDYKNVDWVEVLKK